MAQKIGILPYSLREGQKYDLYITMLPDADCVRDFY